MTIIRFTRKQQFIDALEARRAWVRNLDKAATVKHRADEKAVLDAYRAKCRANVKLSYAELNAMPWKDRDIDWRGISCPTLNEPKLDAILAALAPSRQEAFTVSSSGEWGTAHWLLTHDETAARTPC